MTSIDTSRSVGVYIKNNKRKQSDILEELNKKINNVEKHIFKAFELKSIEIRTGLPNVSIFGAVECFMYQINKGMNETQRIGKQVMVKSIEYKIYIYVRDLTLVTQALAGYGSISIIQDKLPTGIVPIINEVYDISDPTSYIKHDAKKKFKELTEHFFSYGTYTIDTIGEIFEGYIEINEITQYTQDTNNQVDMTNGSNDYIVTVRSSNTYFDSYGYSMIFKINYIDA